MTPGLRRLLLTGVLSMLSAALTPRTRPARPRLRPLLLAWVLLMALLAIEFGAAFTPLGRSARPFVLIPAVLMVAVVGTLFMRVGRGVTIVRLFAAAGLLWLGILLGLGSLDPLTRTDYPVQTGNPQ
ncbi:MAG TPA: hypothetical protein VFC56_16690 [Stellaceae bacterium]|nr:hypothetical protein [Stellaceae bacterium]